MIGIALFVLCFSLDANGYNVDTQFPIVFVSKPGSYFGYTVALHRNKDGPLALVGAPKANSTQGGNLKSPGALYKCDIEKNRDNDFSICEQIALYENHDIRGHDPKGIDFNYQEKKSGMWLGVSLDVQQNSARNDIVTCGHKWTNQIYKQNYFLNGACYVIDGDFKKKSSKLIPFVDKKQIYIDKIYKYAFGQVGSSAAFTEDGKYLLLGAPGYYHWSGTVVSYDLNPEKSFQDDYKRHAVPGPPQGQSIPWDSYIGYSVTSGKFYEDGFDYVAAGAPRDGELQGRVYIYKAVKFSPERLIVHRKKDGSQLGEYYGASLLGMNLNGDGFTDLLVGATLYSSGLGVDEGKVYVYISNGKGLQAHSELHGKAATNARFGSAIANVGDLNQDGYNDVAIGAPYEDGNGVVYIYHGSHTGINTKYMQRISAIEIDPYISGFGIHISRGLDIDENQYPDLLIGAYTSSKAVLFRTRPVIQIASEMTFAPKQINTNVTHCYYNGKHAPCINVTVCLQYIGNHVPQHLDFHHEILVEPSNQGTAFSSRAFFIRKGLPSTKIWIKSTIYEGTYDCFTEELFIKPDIKDVINPVQLLHKYSLVGSNETRKEFKKSFPVIDSTSSNNVTYSLSFQTGCGTDDTCHSDLQLTVTMLEVADNSPLIIGEKSTLSLVIEVVNKGEPAYLSELLIYLPSELPSINQDICSSVTNEHGHRKNATLLCDLGNPLSKDQKVKIQIKLDLSKIPTNKDEVTIAFEALTGSTEIHPEDNSKLLTLRFKAFADISISGSSSHEQIPYDAKTEGKFPAFITHSFFIMNHGPSPVEVIDIVLQIPTTFEGNNGGEFVTFTSLEVDGGTIPAICNDTYLEIKPVSADVSKNRDIIIDDQLAQENNQSKTVVGLDYGVDKFDYPDDSPTAVRSKRSNDRKSIRRNDVIISCDTAKCKAIQCSAAPFTDIKKFAKITVSVQVNMSIINEYISDPWYRIEFVTSGEVLIREDESGVIARHHHPDQTTVKTTIVSSVLPPTEEIAQWIIFVSIGIGILLLLIILALLIKFGFFKREKMEKMERIKSTAGPSGYDPLPKIEVISTDIEELN